MTKPTWLKDAIAKEDGYYSTTGERLKVARLSAGQIAEWNGVKPAKPAPAVEVTEVEEPAEETVVEKLVKKVSRKKKK